MCEHAVELKRSDKKVFACPYDLTLTFSSKDGVGCPENHDPHNCTSVKRAEWNENTNERNMHKRSGGPVSSTAVKIDGVYGSHRTGNHN